MAVAYIIILLTATVVLFSLEKLSVDLITLLLLVALIVPGILTPSEAFSGFGSDIVVILGSIFVISAALQDAGVLDWIGDQMRRRAHVGSKSFLLGMMGVVGGMSAFMNNTTVTALFTPVVSGLARKGNVSPSKLLMPVAFASILGGTITLIGTSTNVAVSGFIQREGMKPLGMFEMTPIGLIILAVGILYMMLIGIRFLPVHKLEEDLAEGFTLRKYLSEILVLPGSPLVGQPIGECDLAILDFQVLKIGRGAQTIFPEPGLQIEEGDLLIVSGNIQNLLSVRKIEGIEVRADRNFASSDLEGDETHMAEVLVAARSQAIGHRLVEMDLHAKAGVSVIAIYRHGQTFVESLEEIRIREGDVLLVQSEPSGFTLLQENFGLPVLEQVTAPHRKSARGLAVVGIFFAAVLCGSLGVLPLSACFLIAALAAILIGAVSMERAYQFIDWRLLILIGGMTAFGVAMEKTGTAQFLSELIMHSFAPLGTLGILAGFFVLTVIFTQPMSNAAAALVVLPVAIKTAELLGSNPRTFAIGIMLAASVSFIAPLEPSCILVYGPGKYRFSDFVKVGSGLTLVLAVVVLLLLPVFWPL